MTETIQDQSSVPSVLRRFALLAMLYSALILLLPVSEITLKVYSLTSAEYHLLLFTIALPSFLAWFAAFIGYARLYDYANSVGSTVEGASYKQLARGCTWLAWALPVPTILTLLLNSASYRYVQFHPTAIIISNFIALIMPLIAFVLIGNAARTLTATGTVPFSLAKARGVIALFAIGGLTYVYLTFTHFDLESINATDNPYFLPLWLMLLTIIIPYLYTWFTGLLAAFEVYLFSRNVRGVLYRQALQLLVAGIVTVVISSIALQYINSASPRTGYLALNYKLVVVSLFRIIAGLGFVLVAVGANKLKKIEEV